MPSPARSTVGLRILLAEDNATSALIVTALLERRGLTVIQASNGAEALDKFREGHFDLVLLDWQMPLMDGLQAATSIRELEASLARRTPIVGLSAEQEQDAEERCKRAGMDGYLLKPVDEAKVVFLIEQYLSGKAPPELTAESPPDEVSHVTPGSSSVGLLDCEEALRRIRDKLPLYRALVTIFVETSRDCLAVLEVAIPTGDIAAVGHEGHKLKGAAMIVGAVSVAECGRKLESLAAPEVANEGSRIVDELRDTLERSLDEFVRRGYLESSKG